MPGDVCRIIYDSLPPPIPPAPISLPRVIVLLDLVYPAICVQDEALDLHIGFRF
jgi:hypothetical protein